MSDEIDIEEHDVMDNPTIRRIFPDLSVIKKEISQYYEEELDPTPASKPLNLLSVPLSPSSYAPTNPSSPKNTSTKFENFYDDCLKEEKNTTLNNIIILGSKPNKSFENGEYQAKQICKVAKVTIKNIKHYLNNSKMYCGKCLILFPNISGFKNHVRTVHNPRKNNSFIHKRKGVGTKTSIKIHKCTFCNVVFSANGNLYRHFRNVHKVSGEKFNNMVELNDKNNDLVDKELFDDDDDRVSAPSGSDMSCYHCHNVFPTHKLLIDHLYDILEPKDKHDNKITDQDNSKEFNTSSHNEPNPVPNAFKCAICEMQFVTKVKLNEHNKHKHKDISAETPNPNGKNKLKNKVIFEDSSESEDEPLIVMKRLRKTVKYNDDEVASDASNNSRYDDLNKKLSLHKKPNLALGKNSIENKKTDNKSVCPKLIKEIDVKHKNDHNSNELVEKAYQCVVCFYYFLTVQNYNRHMTKNHNMVNIPKVKKESINAQCKFCEYSKITSLKSNNAHIMKYHEYKTRLNIQNAKMETRRKYRKREVSKKELQFALKSVLFKCTKCDIHFLTASATLNHQAHMEILVNWKCFICSKIFKRIDKSYHMRQHSCSDTFTIYNMCDSSEVLYTCPKCAIHFSEANYLRHYPICGTKIPESVYCKICDSLIHAVDFDSHNVTHEKKQHLKHFHFITIEAELIVNNDTISNTVQSENNAKKSNQINVRLNAQEYSKFHMTFCHSCQSFLTNLGSTRKAHIEARCMHIKKYICEECGLVFTNQSIKNHRRAHKEVKGLNIQKMFFFDIKTKIQICPPIPQYPNCELCGIHFLYRNDVFEHDCNNCDHVVCEICKIKLNKAAYKLHKQFHEYSMESSEVLFGNVKQPREDNNTELSKETDLATETFLYTCNICKITFDCYDSVVKHCQSHYDGSIAQSHVVMQNCKYCKFSFDARYYKIHEKLHSCKTSELKSINAIDFDPLFFIFDNSIWIDHIFESMLWEKAEKTLIGSIYRYEGRLKMELFQSGLSNNTLYKCEKCMTIIDPQFLYVHVKNLQCSKLKKYSCGHCELYFDSAKAKTDHENIHEASNKTGKSRVVVFNKNNDQIYHNSMFNIQNQYMLYQCRTCHVAIDKLQRNVHSCDISEVIKCDRCELLIDKQDYATHINRHNKIHNYNTDHIVVVLFGKNRYQNKQKFSSSFAGQIHDYTFYKCKTCDLCVKTVDSTFNHNCIFDDLKLKCSKCGLWFHRDELAIHNMLHDTDVEIESPNLNVIEFGGHSILNHSKRIFENKENSTVQNEKQINEISRNEELTTPSSVNAVKIYKCDCDLHFIDEVNARNHYNNCNPKMKLSKQNCSKCELLFTPGELFTHLLTHHRDKASEFKFDIVPLSKDNKRPEIFKCTKCDLHFVKEYEVVKHFSSCDGTTITDIKCKKCRYRFKMTSYYKHKHSQMCEIIYSVNDISEVKHIEPPIEEQVKDSPAVMDNFVSDTDMVLAPEYSISRDHLQKLDISKYNNVLYKCHICDVFYLSIHTRKRHPHFTTVNNACNICGFNFSLQSLPKHMYIHHEKLNLTKDDFVIL